MDVRVAEKIDKEHGKGGQGNTISKDKTYRMAVKMVAGLRPRDGSLSALSFNGVALRHAVARGGWFAAVAGGPRHNEVAGGAPRDCGERVEEFGGAVCAGRAAERTWLSVGGADAKARAAAAAVELSVDRWRTPRLLTLKTVFVSGMSRHAVHHRLRAKLADGMVVDGHALVDVDRFRATTAMTLVADAAAAFCAALGVGRAAEVVRVLPGADPWVSARLGLAHRRTLGGGPRAAEVAVPLCRQRLVGTL